MFGLLGKTLNYSLSPVIHASLGDSNYQLWESNDLEQFMKSCHFEGMNVTIPYKEAIIPYLDGIDGIAKTIGCVNTVVKRDGQLIGYNTDYYGLFKLLQYHKIELKNKTVLIVGNGGAAKTATLLAHNLGAKIVTKICRKPRMDDEIFLTEITQVIDYEIIINTTPVGTYPHNDDSFLFSLLEFKKLEAVIDLVYNPLKTKLLIEAESLNIKTANGLYMLVMQAKAARELFTNDTNIDHQLAKKIYFDLLMSKYNLVLVGLPLSGKSLYADLLSMRYQKKLIDTDALIEQEEGMRIYEIFDKMGEPYFRNLESMLVDRLYKTNSQVISTGGGMIMNADLMQKLKQNGIIIYLDKDYHRIMSVEIKNRPLIKKPEDVEKLALIRRPYYERYADIQILMNRRSDEIILEIEEKLNDYFNRQWS